MLFPSNELLYVALLTTYVQRLKEVSEAIHS